MKTSDHQATSHPGWAPAYVSLEEPLGAGWVVAEAAVAYGTTDDLYSALRQIKDGLPLAEFDALAEQLGLTQEEMAQKIGLSLPTLHRRRKAGRPLDPEQSDHLWRFRRLFGLAVDLFEGHREHARAWLKEPARYFNYTSPLEIAETEVGAREVERLIGRLQYGVLT